MEIAFFAIGISFLGVFAYVQVRGAIFAHVEGRHLDQAIAREKADPSPDSVQAAVGSLLGRIEIPRAGISALVVEGAWEDELDKAVGRVVGTARFGEKGTVALAGHRDRHFRGLGKVAGGDTVTVTTPRATFAYLIDSTRITRPDQVRFTTSASRGLTLITCYPFGFIGHAPKRFLVFAHQLDAGKDLESEPAHTEAAGPSSPPSEGDRRSPSTTGGDQRLKYGSFTIRRPDPVDSSGTAGDVGASSLRSRQSS